MTSLVTITALILGMTSQIKYPAICKESYLSDEKVENVNKVANSLARKPGCMQIGEETITEGDRAGQVFPIYTCCTSVEAEKK